MHKGLNSNAFFFKSKHNSKFLVSYQIIHIRLNYKQVEVKETKYLFLEIIIQGNFKEFNYVRYASQCTCNNLNLILRYKINSVI